VFWAGALAWIGGLPEDGVVERLHELVRKEFVRRARSSSIEGDAEYVFSHVLVRDVAYAQIPRAARARKHVAAAAWIEGVSGERAPERSELLAHHYATALELARAAGDTELADALDDLAVRFGTLAAERASGLDQSQGLRYYRQTLALLGEDDPRRPKL